jgi:hypothetical protein
MICFTTIRAEPLAAAELGFSLTLDYVRQRNEGIRKCPAGQFELAHGAMMKL